jgi:hypothetical protein
MSKLGCKCGHIIRDQTDNIPYKGHVLLDIRHATFFDWLVEETQSYVEAAQAGRVKQWLLERGYAQDYVDRKLGQGHVLDLLHYRIHMQFRKLKRDLYECAACGRIHMQTRDGDKFVSYAPDNGKVNAILAALPID